MLELLDLVKLPRAFADRMPRQLSGGQKQRVGIARAFAGGAKVVVADEPVSALDVSVQAAVTDLLMEIQRENQTTLLFISHDLSIVRYLSDRVVVMYLGHVVEIGTTDQVFSPPYHPYTEALLSAVPIADTRVKKKRIVLEGDIPSAMNPPPGCPFQTRCRWKAQVPGNQCDTEMPPMRELGERPSHQVLAAGRAAGGDGAGDPDRRGIATCRAAGGATGRPFLPARWALPRCRNGTGPEMRLLPPHYFGICLAATLILVVAVPAWPTLENARFIGPLLLALGFWFLFVAYGAFQRRGTTIKPFDTPSVLVTSGPFAVSRNPIYLGFALMIGGLGLLGATPWALIPCLIFFAIMNWQFIPREEANAEAAFGAAIGSTRTACAAGFQANRHRGPTKPTGA